MQLLLVIVEWQTVSGSVLFACAILLDIKDIYNTFLLFI